MKKIFWAMSFVFFFGSLSQATTDWSRIDLDYLPSTTVVTISQDVNFEPFNNIASIGSVGGSNLQYAIQCYLYLNNPWANRNPNGLILKGPVNLASFSVIKRFPDKWYGAQYHINVKSNKQLVGGIYCIAGNMIGGGVSISDFANIVSQIGTIVLPTPDHQ